MSSIFYTPKEKRYANYPRRWLNEYHHDARTVEPQAKGSCSTLHNARKRAVMSVDQEFCTVTRIFDRKTGQYVFTYKASAHGVTRHEGYVK